MFYIYHKVKGDRAGPAEYELLGSRTSRQLAKDDAAAYNSKHGYKPGGFHYAVVRTRRVH